MLLAHAHSTINVLHLPSWFVFACFHVCVYIHGCAWCVFYTCASTQLATVQQSTQFTRLSKTTCQTTPNFYDYIQPLDDLRLDIVQLNSLSRGSVNWLSAMRLTSPTNEELIQDLELVTSLQLSCYPSWLMGYINTHGNSTQTQYTPFLHEGEFSQDCHYTPWKTAGNQLE